jgi:hypothetical protein
VLLSNDFSNNSIIIAKGHCDLYASIPHLNRPKDPYRREK